MVDFNYLKDNRSLSKYQSDFEVGIRNQKILIQEVKKMFTDYKIEELWIDKNEKFQMVMEKIETYKPDVKLTFNGRNGSFSRDYEVKTTPYSFKDYLDIKEYQVEVLYALYPNSHILFAEPERFCSVPVEYIYKHTKRAPSPYIGGKVCCRVWKPAIFELWQYFPEPIVFSQSKRAVFHTQAQDLSSN